MYVAGLIPTYHLNPEWRLKLYTHPEALQAGIQYVSLDEGSSSNESTTIYPPTHPRGPKPGTWNQTGGP